MEKRKDIKTFHYIQDEGLLNIVDFSTTLAQYQDRNVIQFSAFLNRIKHQGKFIPFQDWLAFTQGASQLTFQGKLQFENGGAPLEQDNYAFCKVMIQN